MLKLNYLLLPIASALVVCSLFAAKEMLNEELHFVDVMTSPLLAQSTKYRDEEIRKAE